MDTDISFKFFSELPPDEVVKFNNSNYSVTYDIDSLKWRFRIGFDPQIEPVFILYKGEICGQAGLIPNKLIMNGESQNINWFNKFIVSNKLQGKGFGKLLTERWMLLSDVCITNCNDKSMSVFRKYGWDEELSTSRYALPLNLTVLAENNGWTGMKLLGAKLINPFYLIYTKKYSGKAKNIEIIPVLNWSIDSLIPYFESSERNYLLKDKSWVQWRLLSGHLAKEYYTIKLNSSLLVFREFKLKNVKRIHVVFQTTNSIEDNEILLSTLIKYSIQKSIDLIWAFTNINSLIGLYKKYLPQTLNTRLAYYAKYKSLLDYLLANSIHVQAIDSDYDSMYEE
jgi:hypothetical protein